MLNEHWTAPTTTTTTKVIKEYCELFHSYIIAVVDRTTERRQPSRYDSITHSLRSQCAPGVHSAAFGVPHGICRPRINWQRARKDRNNNSEKCHKSLEFNGFCSVVQWNVEMLHRFDIGPRIISAMNYEILQATDRSLRSFTSIEHQYCDYVHVEWL